MHRIVLSLLLMLIFMAPQAAMAATVSGTSSKAELSSVRWLVHKDAVEGTSRLRLVIDTTGPVKINSVLSEKSGSQLMIDVKDGIFASKGL